jgi:plasmid stabilization system protein ParE
MTLTIKWTPRASSDFDKIVKHLEEKWTEKEVESFILETKHFLEILSKNPKLLERTERNKNVYRGPMNRLTILTYRVKPRKKLIELIYIRGARQQPLK